MFQKISRNFFFQRENFCEGNTENLLGHYGIFHFQHEIFGQQQQTNSSSTPKC